MISLISSFQLNTLTISITLGCAFAIGMAKSGVPAIGLLVVPILATVFGSKESTGILLPMLIMADVFAVIYYHQHCEWKFIIKLLPWVLIGILLGTLTGNKLNPLIFKKILSILVFISLALLIWRDIQKNKQWVPKHILFSTFFGILAGFSTMIGNAAGPIMAVYMLSWGLDKNNYIGTLAYFFLIVNLIKVPLQIFVWNNINIQTLTLNLLLLPAIIIGIFTGIWIVQKISDVYYRWFILIATLGSALFLLK